MPTRRGRLALAAQMAVEDSGLSKKGWKIDVDPRRSPEQAGYRGRTSRGNGSTSTRSTSSSTCPIPGVAWRSTKSSRTRTGVFLANSGAASSDLTGKACTPNTVHWAYDTYTLANGTGTALTKAGGNTWFFITADYAFGHALERDTGGGSRKGTAARSSAKCAIRSTRPISHPFFCRRKPLAQRSSASPMPAATRPMRSNKRPNSALPRAARSSPGFCSSSMTSMRLGMSLAHGLTLTTSFYWDLNDQNS